MKEGTDVNSDTPSKEGTNVSGGQTNSTEAGKSLLSKKKPYVAPAFRFERVFEVNALSCGKITATQSTCRFSTKTS
jgi:hypothetical protein